MRNNKFVITAIVLVVFLLLLLLYAFLSRGSGNAPQITEPSAPFEPFGETSPIGNFDTGLPTVSTTTSAANIPLPRLRRLSEEPVAAATIVPLEKQVGEETTGLAARFVDRATGHIFETRIDAISPIAVLSNTTIPKVADAVFGNAEILLYSYLNQDEGVLSHFLARIVPSATNTPDKSGETENAPAELDGRFLPTTTKWLAFNTTGNEFAYLVANASGSGLFSYNLENAKVTRLWSSPLRELFPMYYGTEVVLSTLPSFGMPGQAFRISEENGMRFLFIDVPTLMVKTRPEGEELLALRLSNDNTGVLVDRQMAGKPEEKDTPLPFVTLPEKCLFRHGFTGQIICAVPALLPKDMPDSWLRGDSTLNDRVVAFDTTTYTTRVIAEPEREAGIVMDITKPILSEDGRFLIFINRNDESLWALRIDE